MREIYNEGRVVGLSAWELYVRHVMSKDPTATPLNEQEWLSASLSSNTSMILRIPEGTPRGIHDFKLPQDSDLCGCSVIYGTVFEGEVTLDDTGMWAARVDDYGRLISNTIELHPQTPGEPEDVPTKEGDPIDVDPKFADMCKDYLKISGGLMFQPGEWHDNIYYEEVVTQSSIELLTQDNDTILAPMTDMIAHMSLEPDIAKTGFIRIAITGELNNDLYILLRGFSYKSLVVGEVGYAYVPDVGKPADGGFLGPATFPWGCQVIFLIDNQVMRSILDGQVSPGTPIPEWVEEWNPSWKDFDGGHL